MIIPHFKPLLIGLFGIIIVSASYLYYLSTLTFPLSPSENQISLEGTVMLGGDTKPDHLCTNEYYLVTQNGLTLLVLDKKGTVATQRYFSPYLNTRVSLVGIKHKNPDMCVTEKTECICNSNFILLVDDIKNTNVLLQISTKVKQMLQNRL